MKKNRVSWFQSRSIAIKHFVFLFAGSLILFGLLAWNNLQDAEQLFRKQVLTDAKVIIDRTNLYLDAYLDNVQNILLLLSTRDDLLDEGKEQEAIEVLRKYAEKNSALYRTLYLVRADGKVMSNSQVYLDIIGNTHLSTLYKQAQSNYGIMISEPYESSLSGKTVAFILPITSKSEDEVKGMAVIEIDLIRLTNMLAQFMNTRNQTFTIVTNKNNVVNTFDATWPLYYYALLPYNTAVFPPELKSAFVSQISELPVGITELNGAKGKLVAVKSGMNKLGWYFIAFIEDSYFYQNIISLYNNYKTAAFVWVLILLISSYMMSRYVTYPVRMLVAKMDRVRDMEVLPSISVQREDEIGRLAKSYNAMMERIHHLLIETKEMETRKNQYELKMLQSQIAPHFLYNTLACISSLAKQQKTDAVRETIRSLVGLLSFSFDKSSEFVTLQDELEGLKMYAHIQTVRYGAKFSIEMDIAPDTLDCKILKLTLQPLVENAIFHGLAPQKVQGLIRIRAFVRRGKLLIIIRDNGLGMSSLQLESVFSERRKAPSKHRFTGIGIMNVHERIRLHFGAEYGLRIASLPEVGTLIRIKLPELSFKE
ncbi:HAMP domain-containing protein [Paenibacillus sp. LMG 31456]|uniref:histidine kinase n=1 Tax=Paenibacillus foliorum TaxID=2654974 RepID=A0A972GW04_9BACL|nr:sensor histidine kinase [Paenibacillus foliorum]NOU93825.1 HAMP domain-containing protein [Paenibacillus foliorum]